MSDYSKGDLIVYRGTLGEHKGVVAEVRELFDESGAELTAYVVALDGLGRVFTSADALSPARTEVPASINIPREAYADTSVPPPVAPVVPEQAAAPVEQPPAPEEPSNG